MHAQHAVQPLAATRPARAPGRESAHRGSSPWPARCAGRASARGSGTPARSPRSSGRRPRASVSATCASGASAGWQQVKISRSRSSSMPSSSPGSAAIHRRALRPAPGLSSIEIEARAPADAVDGLEAAGRDEPCARIGRHPVARPLLERRPERVVQRLLGEIEVAEQANQRREDAARFGCGRFLPPARECDQESARSSAHFPGGQRPSSRSPAP